MRSVPPPAVVAPPVRQRALVVRPRLDAELDAAGAARLVLVSAPAGFGKTTLVADWLRRRSIRFAWLSLDAAANDVTRFLWSIGRALDAADGADPADEDEAPSPGGLHRHLDRLAAGGGRFVLVLDDYHLVVEPQVHALVADLVERLPGDAQVVVATRSDPPLPLSRLRARGELVELRAADLRFDADEGSSLLRLLGTPLQPADAERLVARAEGWAAALQLASVTLRGRGDQHEAVQAFGASNRFVLDFIVDEVLARVDDDVRGFLLDTSVLDRMTGGLCDALTGRSDGAAMLARLERENLLLFPLDQERRWYRYHALFRDLLQARLAGLAADRLPALHRRAGDWFEADGSIEAAVIHALAAHDEAAAVRRIRACWMPIMHAGELRTVERWLDALPPARLRDDPQLSAVYAWGLVLRGETDGVDERAAAAEAALERPDVEPVDRLLVPSQLEAIRAIQASHRGDLAGAVRHAEHAIALVPDGLEPELDALLRGDAMSLLGNAYLASGNDAGAAVAFRAALPLLRRGGNHLGVAHGLRDLVRIETRRGRPGASLAVADDGLAALGTDAHKPAYAAVLVARAEALAAMGRRLDAHADATRAEERAARGGEDSVAREARALLDALAREGARPVVSPLAEPLTARELEVLGLVARGRSNTEIAGELFVTVGTVKSHVHAITGKLGVPNRVGAIVRARELGLLD